MALRYGIVATALLALAKSAYACPSTDHTVKRWFSVGNPAAGEPLTNNAWPTHDAAPWDRPVRYCWDTKQDYVNLGPTLDAAIKIWQPAIGDNGEVSSLRIIPDGGRANPGILCKDASADALQIKDIDPNSGNVHGTTTVGYWSQPKNRQTRGRHILHFERLMNRDTPNNPHPYDVATFAHELGHAFGFEHEHDRPDRDKFISFYCKNLRDYDVVKQRIAQQNPGRNIEELMEQACTDLPTAQKYGFSAFAFIKIASRAPAMGQFA